jgi:S1-C subfamily serine protease
MIIGFISHPDKSIIEIKETHTAHIESGKALDEELEKRTELSKKGKRLVDPVVMIMIRDEDMDIVSSGTGFSIKYDKKTDTSYFLTNNHICEDVKEEHTITSLSSRNHSSTIRYTHFDATLEIVMTEPKHDLCLLKRSGKVKPVKFTDNIPSQMDVLTVVGAPHGNFPIMIDSMFAGYLNRGEAFESMMGSGYSYLMLSEIYHGGISGSPIYDAKGEVVGIMFGSLGKWNGTMRVSSYGGLGVQTAEIKYFLEENNFKL